MCQQEILRKVSIVNVKNKLNLTEVYSKKDIIYVRCPFCMSTKGTMKLNIINNSYICKNCESSGYAIGLYAKCNNISNREAYKNLIEQTADINCEPTNFLIGNMKKNDDELDIVYQSLLESLKLDSRHKAKLLQYGFSAEQIEKIGFKTVPIQGDIKAKICRDLINDGINLEGIPGFYKDKRFRWTFKSHNGIFIPVKESGKIIALRIHLDTLYSIDTSDIWFSSSLEIEGSKINNCIMILFPENGVLQLYNNNEEKDIIIASEMILAYKVASVCNDKIVIGIPNVITKNETKKLNRIKDVKKVYLIEDSHTVLHNSCNLLSYLFKKYGEQNVELGFSLKNCEIPTDVMSKIDNNKYCSKKIA